MVLIFPSVGQISVFEQKLSKYFSSNDPAFDSRQDILPTVLGRPLWQETGLCFVRRRGPRLWQIVTVFDTLAAVRSVNTASVRPGQARPGQVRPGQARSGQARPGQARPGQARPGQVRSGQVRPGQARPGQARPCTADCPKLYLAVATTTARHCKPLSPPVAIFKPPHGNLKRFFFPSAEESVCYGELGCFSVEEPWSSPLRPVPLPDKPEVIQTRFYLYTRYSRRSADHNWDWLSNTKQRDLFYIRCSLNSKCALLFLGFPGFASLSICYEQHVDEYEYGDLVECYWEGRQTKGLGEKPLLKCLWHDMRHRNVTERGERQKDWERNRFRNVYDMTCGTGILHKMYRTSTNFVKIGSVKVTLY